MPGHCRGARLLRLNHTSHVTRPLVKGLAHSVVKQLEHTYDDNRVTVEIKASQEPTGKNTPSLTARNNFIYTASDSLGESTGNPVFASNAEKAEGELGNVALLNHLRKRGCYLRDEFSDYVWNPRQAGVRIDFTRARTEKTEDGYRWSIEVYTAVRRTPIQMPLKTE